MAHTRTSVSHHSRRTRQLGWGLVYAILIGSGIWLLAHQTDNVMAAIRAIRLAHISQLIAAIVVFALSVLWASGVYHALLPGRLLYGRTVVVQAAGLCANKLLPSGSGAIGLSYLYLRKAKIRSADAAAAVTANNLLGFVGNVLLVAALLIFQPSSRAFGFWHARWPHGIVWVGLAVVILLVAVAVTGRRHLSAWWQAVRTYLTSLGRVLHSRRVALALLFSLGITLTYITALWLVGNAVGVAMSFAQMAVVMTASVAATSLVPTPGGIGAAEAGIYGALRLYGISSESALAIALLYRLATFWIPLVYGATALVLVRRKHYI